jgi:flagellar L-ring protein precursor FlgH
MMTVIHRRAQALRLPIVLVAGLGLSGCGDTLTRLNQIGEKPPLQTIENPVTQPGYKPVTMPMPTPITHFHQPSSLWEPGTRAFFKDQRASQVGDILTVVVDIADQASLNNSTSRTRANSENLAVPNFLGLEKTLTHLVGPSTSGTPGQVIDATSSSSSAGVGNITRGETVSVRVAAIVTQVLPNGDLVIHGSQQMRVNFDVRDLDVAGVVRPLDISSTNEVTLDKLAEARVNYGGRGQNMDVQQPRLGQQLFDILFPF